MATDVEQAIRRMTRVLWFSAAMMFATVFLIHFGFLKMALAVVAGVMLLFFYTVRELDAL